MTLENVDQSPQNRSGNGYVEQRPDGTVAVSKNFLVYPRWSNMLRDSQRDGRERGFLVSEGKKGQMHVSGIFEGTNQRTIDGESTNADLPIPAHIDFMNMLLGREVVLSVHTHPMPSPIMDRFPTTVTTDEDISQVKKLLVIIDRGGAHLLVKWHEDSVNREDPSQEELVERILEQTKARGGLMVDIIHEVAKQLEGRGIGYYFCKTENFEEETDSVVFSSAKNLQF